MVGRDTHPEVGEINWRDIIGSVYRLEDLPPDVQNDEGLIILTTEDGRRYCPIKQFNPQIITEKGSIAPVVDEWVGSLWQIAKKLEMKRLGFDGWTTASSILYPLLGDTQSVIDRLFACSDDVARRQVIGKYIERSLRGAAWNNVRL